MPESLSPELIALRDTCADFAATHLATTDSSAETRARVSAQQLKQRACSPLPNRVKAQGRHPNWGCA